MRHALMAEQRRSEMNQRQQDLMNECEMLEEKLDKLKQDKIDIEKQDEEDRTRLAEEHKKFKEDMALIIYNIKEELDTVLSRPDFNL